MSEGFWRADGDAVLLSIRLTPRSGKDRIGGLWRDEKEAVWLCAQVRAVPEKGKANVALIQLMAKALNIPASRISLEAGDTSRQKRLRVVCDAQTIEPLLKEWMAS